MAAWALHFHLRPCFARLKVSLDTLDLFSNVLSPTEFQSQARHSLHCTQQAVLPSFIRALPPVGKASVTGGADDAEEEDDEPPSPYPFLPFLLERLPWLWPLWKEADAGGT